VGKPADEPVVLVVEDNPLFGAVVVAALCRTGLTVEALSRGDDALERMKLAKPDLVLLDLALPAVSGLTLLTEMRADPLLRDVPAIVLTAYTGRSMEHEAKSLGAAHYLIKGDVGLEDIVRIVHEILRRQPVP
jgi:chemosensory pili system protein ChpA (sensor histidine kinase/response regulator)